MYADLMVELAEGDLKAYAEKQQASIRQSTEILRNVATIRRIREESVSLAPVSLDAVIRDEIGNLRQHRSGTKTPGFGSAQIAFSR